MWHRTIGGIAIPLGSNDSLLQVTLQKAYEELAGVRSSVKAGSAPLSIKKGFVNRLKFLKDFYFSNFKDSEDSTEEVFHDAQEN